MVLAKFILLSIANIILRVLGYILVPIGVYITPLTEYKLPKYLNWYNHQTGFGVSKYDSLFLEGLNRKGINPHLHLARILWLWRNKTDIFNYKYADYVISEPVYIPFESFKGENLGDREGQSSGYIKAKSGDYFEYYSIKPYNVFKWTFCIRTRLGWKLTSQGHPRKVGDRAEWVLTCNPVHPYRGL